MCVCVGGLSGCDTYHTSLSSVHKAATWIVPCGCHLDPASTTWLPRCIHWLLRGYHVVCTLVGIVHRGLDSFHPNGLVKFRQVQASILAYFLDWRYNFFKTASWLRGEPSLSISVMVTIVLEMQFYWVGQMQISKITWGTIGITGWIMSKYFCKIESWHWFQ